MDFKNSRIKLSCILIAIVITYWLVSIIPFVLFEHIPWRDEAHAWLIAKNLNIVEVFEYMKYEGHLFIWYLILMPFAKTNFYYPYSMQIINLLFVLASIFIFWKYSKFNSVAKCVISCSLIYSLTALFARCYGVGMFLLSLAAVLYKDRMKHPILYAFILLLAANTSIVVMFGAFILGGIFIVELLIKYLKSKEKTELKNLILVSSIGFLAFILVYLQIGHATPPLYSFHMKKKCYSILINFLENNITCGRILSLFFYIICCSSFVLFRKDIKPYIFLITTVFSLVYFSNHYYKLYNYHLIFVLFYLVVAIWIYLSENKPNKLSQRVFLNCFFVFMVVFGIYADSLTYANNMRSDWEYEIMDDLSNKHYSDTKLFLFSREFFTQHYEYLQKHGFELYDSWGEPVNSYQYLINRWENKSANFEKIKEVATSNEALILVRKNFDTGFSRNAKRLNVQLKKIKAYNSYTLYKIDLTNLNTKLKTNPIEDKK